MARNVYLVGSVPMANAADVFETISAALGARIKRLPDGETGARGDWITWLEPVFADNPALQKSGEFFRVHASGTGRERYALRPGFRAEDVRFDNLFYADIANKSYADFKRLKDAGKIAAGTKFQVDLVPAHSVIWLFLVDALHAPIDPVYNDALKHEIDKIAAAIPHDELAIQFDVASAVFARLERNEASSYGRTKAETQETFSRIVTDLGNHVPADIDLLYHLCYGDSNHRHVVEPTDMADMVEFANRLSRNITRPIDLIHMPVPRNRADDAYFEPLKRLALRPETQLCLGLVHYTDGIEGTKRRLATAKKYANNFAIGTECGFGRRDPRTTRDRDLSGAAAHPRRDRGSGLSGLRDKPIAHLAETLDLGLHDITDFKKRVGALADAAAGATAEEVAALQAQNVGGVCNLLLGREDELRGVAVLLDLAVHREPDEQIHVVAHEGARHQERAGRGEIVVALAVEPIRAQARTIGANLQIAGGNVVGRHPAGDVIERALGLDVLARLADDAGDLRLPVDLFHAARDGDVVIGAGQRARRFEEQIRMRGRFLAGEFRPLAGVMPARSISSTCS